MNESTCHTLDSAGHALVVLEADGRCAFASRGAGELLGRSAATLVGSDPWSGFGASARAFRKACAEALRDGRGRVASGYHPELDRWIDAHIERGRDGLTLFLADVTDRRRDETLFREVVDASPVPLGLVAGGRVSYLNAAAARSLFPDDADGWLGRQVADLRVPGDEGSARGPRDAGAPGAMRQWWRRPDGATIAVELTPVEAAGGGGAYRLSFPTLEAGPGDRARHDREAYFRSLTEYASDLVSILDEDGNFRYHNAASLRVLGYRAEEIIGLSALEMIHPSDLPAVWRQFERMQLIPGEIFSASFRFRHRDGSWRVLESDGRNLLQDPDVRGFVINSRDVTARVHAEERLRESEERYRLVTRAANDILYDWDRANDRVYWGEALWTVLGYTTEEATEEADWWESRIHPEDRPRVLDSMAAAIEEADAWSEEYRFRRVDGGYAVVYDRALVQRDDEGEVVRVVGSMQDLTEKRLAEVELRAIFQAMQDPVFVVDRDGRYRKVAPTHPDLLFRPAEELVGRTFHDLFPKQQADAFREAVRAALDGGRPVHHEYSHPLRGRDAWFFATISPMNEDTVVWVARDITERRNAREALEQSEAWFRSLTQNALDIVTVLDEGGRIRYSTPSGARILGYEPNEMRGTPLVEMLHPDDRPQVLAALRRLIDGGAEPVTVTARVRAKDGSWQVHEGIAQSLLQDAAVRGIVVNSHDVTEQRLLESQLRQAQKMEAVGRLAGGVAHDFNNVLMAISGFAGLLEGEIDRSSEDVVLYLSEIQKAADRAASLTRQLLAFGRKQALRPEVVNLSQVAESAGGMLRRVIREDVKLVYRLDTRIGTCRVDPHQAEQVLVNLVVNSSDAMPDGGTIEISTRNRLVTDHDRRLLPYVQPGSYVALSVRDTGHGMDEETLGQVFEPFFTTKEVGKGTGLGLSTVYGIVKQSGGYVWGESTPGEGTTFNVIFPRVQAEQTAPRAAATGTLPPGRGTVLLAEDEEAVRLLARLTLQKAGYTVLEARDGAEALRLADAHPGEIDLLVTDVIMPNLGGYALAEQLRTRRPGARVVYMSGYVGRPLGQPSPQLPGAEFLPKPVTPETLTRKVREVMDRPTGDAPAAEA